MEISPFLSVSFALITFLTIALFWWAARFDLKVLFFLLVCLVLHGFLAHNEFYQNTISFPPRIFLSFGLAACSIIVVIGSPKGRQWILKLDIKALTLLHTVRIPVELILYGLFVQKGIPELMTFAGRNFDILAGLTCPVIYYLVFIKKISGHKTLLCWNIITLLLLINIVVHAVLSAPLPFQQMAFDQPNVAILFFPFIWLPALVVPLVLFSHIAAMMQLVDQRQLT